MLRPSSISALVLFLLASAVPAFARSNDTGPAPGQLDCEASFIYMYLDSNTVLFFNNSPEYSSFEWEFNGMAVPVPDNTPVIIQSFDADTSLVCLRIWTEAGCEAESCLSVFPGAHEEACQQTDCVWPGDANGDGKANVYDLLNIGLGYGVDGPERPFFPNEGDHIAWLPNFSWQWAGWLGPVNFKHLDCDGDGFIDEMDAEAIAHNYAPDFEAASNPLPGAPPVYLAFEESLIQFDGEAPPFFELRAGLYLGSSSLPVSGLHGLALYFNYPLGLVVPDSVIVDYEDASFFGQDILEVEKNLAGYGAGRFDLAYSRKNDNGRSGYGKIATIRFIVNGDIIDGLPEPGAHFTASLDGIIMKDADGNPMDYSLSGPDTAHIVINQVVAEAGSAGGPESRFLAYPNPAGEKLFLEFGGLDVNSLLLATPLGQVVMHAPVAARRTELDISRLAPGIYWLVVNTGKGRLVKRILVD